MRNPALISCLLVALGTFGALGCGGGSSGNPENGGGGTSSGTGSSASTSSGGTNGSGGTANGSGGFGNAPTTGLGAYPTKSSKLTAGGTMTFTNVGAKGSWPRRLDRENGDPACTYKDDKDTWGGTCCMTEHETESTTLAPFDEEMTLIVKALHLYQIAIYQPGDGADYSLISSWDERTKEGSNLALTGPKDTVTNFDGDFAKDDCVRYVATTGDYACGNESSYYCPNDPGMLKFGYAGSKLIVLLGDMDFTDSDVKKCDDASQVGHPGPWVAFVASELIRDGGRKWNGACNCYSKTGSVGDGCGEINLFEVVMDGNQYSNREFMSTGVRSFQAGHVGGNVCGAGCSKDDFSGDSEVVDACAMTSFTAVPAIQVGGAADGCPVWKRPEGARYFTILLDETTRTIQVAVIHPENVPAELAPLLPELPTKIPRKTIDDFSNLRLPR